VSQVVAPDELPDVLDAVMQRVASAPHDAIRRTKAKAIRRAAVDLLPTLEL